MRPSLSCSPNFLLRVDIIQLDQSTGNNPLTIAVFSCHELGTDIHNIVINVRFVLSGKRRILLSIKMYLPQVLDIYTCQHHRN